MKKIFCLLLTAAAVFGCKQTSSPAQNEPATDDSARVKVSQQQNSIDPANLFTLSDAEKILGEPAHLADSASAMKIDTFEYRSAYTANAKDQKTGKTGNIYFLFEQYATVSSAQKAYSFFKTSNENHEGVKILHDMGDEAYFHSDGQNFYFVLVRKGDKMFRMKVNKMTSTTSLDGFNQVAKKITADL